MEDFATIRLGVSMGGVVFFLALELVRPYRQPSVSKFRRWAVNIGLTLFNNLLLFIPAGLAAATAVYVNNRDIGLLNMVAMPWWAKTLITVVFMDLMLWVWHLLNHLVPLLWRFHRVHHTDLNMDVSTAARFHVGELFISLFIKVGLVYLLGADLLGLLIFESALLLSAQFHHSSLQAPWGFERLWWILFVPPSMHRIHHSVRIEERDSNYGTIFSFWDRFMGTMVSDVDQSRIKIGVGGHYHDKLDLPRLLIMPFTPPVK